MWNSIKAYAQNYFLIAYAFSSDTEHCIEADVLCNLFNWIAKFNLVTIGSNHIYFGAILWIISNKSSSSKNLYILWKQQLDWGFFLPHFFQYFCFHLVKTKINDYKWKSDQNLHAAKKEYTVVFAAYAMETLRYYTCAYLSKTSITLMLIMLTILLQVDTSFAL